MRKKILVVVCGVAVMFGACQSDQPKVTYKEKVVLPAPLKKHDHIEVKPGLFFDVFNWGDSNDSVSAVLVLRTDTARQSYTSYNLEFEGSYVESFNTDMDTDGNPEMVIYTKANKKFEPANIFCMEFNGDDMNRITFPELTDKTQKQYKGNDKIYVYQGKLRREFDLFENPDDDKAKPVGHKVVEYSLYRNSFDIKEVE